MRILLILITMLSSYLVRAQDSPLPKLQNFIDKLEAQTAELQGGAIAIIYQGKVIYKEVFGYGREDSDPITSSTLFPLGSVSKPVSATAVALLVDKGALNFNQQFKLPFLKNKVSLVNILGHTTGYKFLGNFQIEQGITREKLLEKITLQKPECQPGQCYTYSNTTFSLVEEALNTQKLSLNQAIKNLRSALKTDGIQIVPINLNLEIAYPHTDGKLLPFPPFYPKTVPAAAGVFASLDGMIEFFKLSFGYRPDLISKEILDYIYSPISSNNDIQKWERLLPYNISELDSYYGIGWRILKNKKHPEKELIFHGGYISGMNAFIGFIPSEEIGIIILLNQNSFAAVKNGLSFWKEMINVAFKK